MHVLLGQINAFLDDEMGFTFNEHTLALGSGKLG